MKAYAVYDPNEYEGLQEIVFANSAKEAKVIGWKTSDFLYEAEWIDVRVHRLPFLDDMEDCKTEEIYYVAMVEGGWWYKVGDNHYSEENIELAVEKGLVIPYDNKKQEE